MSKPALTSSSFIIGLFLGAVLFWLYTTQMGGGR